MTFSFFSESLSQQVVDLIPVVNLGLLVWIMWQLTQRKRKW